ncbi:MAG: hypothetical protein JWR05_1947 [Mucilaginibacter sp.]|nr:hypothetical protein [Mucilaginibacter sp.]
MSKNRITTLDGFRCLAIIGVILYHFFILFAKPFSTDYYPYHNKYSNIFFFRYGYLGVQFFFIISGFVIFMTLKNCKNIKEFLLKRFIRLWPTLLFFSILNYAFLSFSPYEAITPQPVYFLPTLTITEPRIWWKIFGWDIKFIDGVEWTLLCEVYFYLVSSVIFFLNKKRFFQNWLLYSSFIVLLHLAIIAFKIPRLGNYVPWLLFPSYLMFFSLGIYFYCLFTKQRLSLSIHVAVILLFVIQLVFMQKPGEIAFILSFIILFLIFIYKNSWLNFLSSKAIITVGIYSYSIYLFHNNIGVLLIHSFSKIFKSTALYLTVLPACIVILITCMTVEKIINKFIHPPLRAILLKKA